MKIWLSYILNLAHFCWHRSVSRNSNWEPLSSQTSINELTLYSQKHFLTVFMIYTTRLQFDFELWAFLYVQYSDFYNQIQNIRQFSTLKILKFRIFKYGVVTNVLNRSSLRLKKSVLWEGGNNAYFQHST